MRRLLFLPLFVLLSAQAKSTAAPDAYLCRGTEPFWSIDISPGRIVFQSPEEDAVTYPYSPPEKAGKGMKYKTALPANAGKNTLQVVLFPGNCTDGMSESAYTHFPTLRRTGRNSAVARCAQMSVKNDAELPD